MMTGKAVALVVGLKLAGATAVGVAFALWCVLTGGLTGPPG